MQDIDLRAERSNDEYTMLSAHMDSNFEHAMTDRWHCLPVSRLPTKLNEVELAAGLSTRCVGEASQILER